MSDLLEIARLAAAGLATVFFSWAAMSKVRDDVDNLVEDLARQGRRNSIGAFFAALVFAAEVARHFWPTI